MNKILTGLCIGGTIAFGVYVVKKLNDIHEEIIYFEKDHGTYWSRKEFNEKFKKLESKTSTGHPRRSGRYPWGSK